MFDDDVVLNEEQFIFDEHIATEQYTLHHHFKPNFRRECTECDFLVIFMHTLDHFHVIFLPNVSNLVHLTTSFNDLIHFFNVHFEILNVECSMDNLHLNILHFFVHHFVLLLFT